MGKWTAMAFGNVAVNHVLKAWPMGGTVVHDEEEASRRLVGFLAHDFGDQGSAGCNTGFRHDLPDYIGCEDIQRCHVGHSSATFIVKLQVSDLAWGRWSGRFLPTTGLDAGLFVETDDKVVTSQRLTIPDSCIKV
jgi:hypothetical protein